MQHLNLTLVGPISSKNESFKALADGIPSLTVSNIKTLEELFPLLSNPSFTTDVIAIDVEHFYEKRGVEIFDIINTLQTLISCTVERVDPGKPKRRNIKIMGIAGDETSIDSIKSINKIVDRILIREGNTFSETDVKEDIKQVLEGGNKNHKKIQELLKRTKKSNIAKNSNDIKLTPRQEQILNIVSNRGSSNKIIAKILKISESTVKLHISSILKKYGVKNRTQLAVFAKHNHQE